MPLFSKGGEHGIIAWCQLSDNIFLGIKLLSGIRAVDCMGQAGAARVGPDAGDHTALGPCHLCAGMLRLLLSHV